MSSYFPNRWPLSYLNLTKNMKTHIRRQQHKNLIKDLFTFTNCLKHSYQPFINLFHCRQSQLFLHISLMFTRYMTNVIFYLIFPLKIFFGKQNSHRWDAAFCSVSSRVILFVKGTPNPYELTVTLFVFLGFLIHIRHFSLLNVNAAGACGYDFPCDGGRLVRAYLRR